jgi:hypothetical protein
MILPFAPAHKKIGQMAGRDYEYKNFLMAMLSI